MRKDLLDVVVSHEADRALVVVRGQIDGDSLSTLRAALDQLEPDEHAVIDMGDVQFISSKALTMVVAHAVRMRQRGGWLHVQNPSRALGRAVDMSGIGELLFEQPVARDRCS